jgi:hypothetical protein
MAYKDRLLRGQRLRDTEGRHKEGDSTDQIQDMWQSFGLGHGAHFSTHIKFFRDKNFHSNV